MIRFADQDPPETSTKDGRECGSVCAWASVSAPVHRSSRLAGALLAGAVTHSTFALAGCGAAPKKTADEARATGRDVLENDEHVDVLVARSCGTVDGMTVAFDDLWRRRQLLPLANGVSIAMPAIPDLILTKRFAARPRDAEDIRLLEALRASTVDDPERT